MNVTPKRSRKVSKKRGPIGQVWDRIGVLTEFAERVPGIGGLLGTLIKLLFVLAFFSLVVGLLATFVVIGVTLQEMIIPGSR
jgi:hypothetical protein